MAITDSQKVDYLWKKVGYAATKTDTSSIKEGFNEAIPSPLQIRGDKVMTDSGIIPGTIPGANTSIVNVYTTSLPIECTNDATASTNRTWKTNVTDWIGPEFGSTYQVKVYVNLSNSAGNAASAGTQLFASGSGNNDEWFFDYQSGVLNFIGTNLPNGVSFTGKSVYVSGARYVGGFGVAPPGGNSIGNLTVSNVTISANSAAVSSSANIILASSGSGAFQFTGNAVGIPSGNTAQRPTVVSPGYIRFNTDVTDIEYWNGSTWYTPALGIAISDTITPDGASNVYTLSSNTSTLGVMVSINGTLQQPTTSYEIINNNQIRFSEIPLTSDIIEIRHIVSGTQTVSPDSLSFGTTLVELDIGNVNVTGNILPSANITYDLGSPTLRWRTGYFSANTIDIGGGTIGLHDTLGFTFTTPGAQPQYMMPNGASTSNTFTSSTVTIQGNLAVAGNATVTGNVSGQYILGSAQFLTGLPVGYSNVNTKAYTESMGFANYSNVNVAAYTQTQSYTNYSNVNLSAYLGGTVTIGGNLTVQGNLFVNGNSTIINANNLSINDSLIYLADDNPADILDIGVVSAFTSAVRYQHTGFVRDASDGVWKLFANVVAEPTTTVDFTNANYSSLLAGNLLTTNDARIGGNTLVTNNGYKTLTLGGSSGGGWLQFLTNGSAGPYIYNTGQNLVLWTDGGNPKITLNNAVDKSIEILSANVDIVSGNARVSGNLTVTGDISANVSGFSIGYRDLPQISAANITLALSDASKHFYANTSAPTTITVPSNANVAFPIGTTIVLVNRGSGSITIQNQGAGAPFLYLAGNATTTTSRTLQQYGMATLVKTETNLWFINGTGLL